MDGALPVDHVTHDGTLIINRVSEEDAGVYECIAIGAYRTIRSRMELFILGWLSSAYPVIYLVLLSTLSCPLFKPPPPVGAGGGYMFSGRTSVRASVRP